VRERERTIEQERRLSLSLSPLTTLAKERTTGTRDFSQGPWERGKHIHVMYV
jgi:hypothetical protein